MKIGSPADKPAAVAPSPTADAAKPAASLGQPVAAAPAADASATVALSSTAATLLSGSSAPEFDAAKVASISEAIASGSFKVNADAIADKLIANAQELLVKVKG